MSSSVSLEISEENPPAFGIEYRSEDMPDGLAAWRAANPDRIHVSSGDVHYSISLEDALKHGLIPPPHESK